MIMFGSMKDGFFTEIAVTCEFLIEIMLKLALSSEYWMQNIM